MIVAAFSFAALALDSDAHLGRAQGLSAAERTQEAWEAAVEALKADPLVTGGPAVYRQVCEAAGLGARCAAEVAADPAPWDEAITALNHDIGHQQHPKSSALAVLDGWPRHPELLTPLWPQTGGFLALQVAQKSVVDRVRRSLSDADVGLAWRAWMLLRLDDGAAPAAVERLRALGEGDVPFRATWNASQRLTQARALAVPEGLYPTERRDVATHLSAELAKGKRLPEMAQIWADFAGTPDEPYAVVHAALDAGSEADLAVAASCRPITADLAVAGPVRTKLVSDAFLARSAASVVADRAGEALGWRLVANALTPLDDGPTERLRLIATADIQAARKRWSREPTFPAILDAARKTAPKDPALARSQALDALFVLAGTVSQRGGLRSADVGEWLAGWGDVAEAAGLPGEARAAWVAATLVHPASSGSVWAHRATAEERDGDREAAFASWSRALARGRPVEAEAERTYHGPGAWRAAADAAGR